MGTLLPFVQGTSSIRRRVTTPVTTLALFFTATSVGMFLLLGAVAELWPAVWDPVSPVQITALAVALGLMVEDIRRLRRGAFCALGVRRQTPERLKSVDAPHFVAALWGIDTGTGFSTFRMTNGWWIIAALTLGGIGQPLAVGTAYGLGFAASLSYAVVFRRPDREGAHALAVHFPATRRLVVALEAGAVLTTGLLLLSGST